MAVEPRKPFNDTVICDIDGTLADCDHRRHHVTSRPKNHKAFYDAMVHDKLIAPVALMIQAMYNQGYHVVLCSGRPDHWRDETVEWLDKHWISYHALYMRRQNDFRPDTDIKLELYHQILDDGYKPFLVIDDRNRLVKMWRDLGLVCLQAAEGDF